MTASGSLSGEADCGVGQQLLVDQLVESPFISTSSGRFWYCAGSRSRSAITWPRVMSVAVDRGEHGLGVVGGFVGWRDGSARRPSATPASTGREKAAHVDLPSARRCGRAV